MNTSPAIVFQLTRIVGIAAFCLTVAACGSLVGLPDNSPASRFMLRPPTVTTAERQSTVIMITEPQAPSALDSERIALRPNDLEIQYYANARWADRLPRMLQNHLIAALTDHVTDAGTETMPLAADYRVETSLMAFEAVYDGGKTPTIHVTLDAKLFSRSPLKLVDRRRFHAEVPAGQDKLASITAAFDQATATVTAEFAAWVLSGATPAP